MLTITINHPLLEALFTKTTESYKLQPGVKGSDEEKETLNRVTASVIMQGFQVLIPLLDNAKAEKALQAFNMWYAETLKHYNDNDSEFLDHATIVTQS